ncbi:M56 family metallopeptidase [Polaribacter sp. MED152]|uniref:M56 family metallopeptidase n=1 Tax=Polaribacter sp. MED152 TaxID=313598 RepID=UPI000068C70B|nr:M56 family metallopeptidase [Polaribacter sp. MED152]EAQ42323.1 BlaR1 peptidase M56 [Polaribacter sp. MED152]
MIIYLLKSATCLALLLGFYHLILEKEKMHNFNRFFLLGSILFSFLAPLYTIYTEAKPILEDESPILLDSIQNTIDFAPIEIVAEEPINYTNYNLICYLFISLILLVRFARNLFKIISKIHTYKKIKYGNAVLVLVNDDILPHTFWNYIFINKKQYEHNEIEDELFTHELTHATQKHTADVLILELFQIAFWINPLFIFLKKAIQINHEFLADESVITQHKNTFQYQHLLLNKAAWKNEYYLASNLNYLVTKKRLKMMTTTSSPTKILLKKLAIAPLLVAFTFLFAQRVEAQEKIIEVKQYIDSPVNNIPIENVSSEDIRIKIKDINKLKISYLDKDTIIEKYKVLIEKAKNSEIIKQKDVIWMTTAYRNMSDEERNSVENIFHYIVADASLSKRKVSENQLKKWQNKSEYAIWIDGKSKENSILKKYKESDFSYYSESFVHKNARSKNFPQNYQVSIYTNKYFKELVNKNTKIKELIKPKSQEVKDVLQEPKKKKYNVPSSNGSKQSLLNNLKLINKVQKDPKFNKGWFITIDNQKYYYTFDKNERIARYYKNGKFVNLDIVKEYKKKQLIFKKLQASGKHYVFKKGKEKETIDREFSDLGGMYFRMSRADKNKVSRPINPLRPYIRLMKNDVVFYKLRKDLTAEDKLLLPPPPPPHNASDEEKLRAKMEREAWKKRTGNTLNQIPPAPKKAKKKRKQKVDQNNVAKSLKVKDTIPKKKKETKITLKNIDTLEEKSFILALQNLTEEEKKKNREKVTYYLNGKVINQKDINKIKPNTIKSTSVNREKDGSKSVKIVTKTI